MTDNYGIKFGTFTHKVDDNKHHIFSLIMDGRIEVFDVINWVECHQTLKWRNRNSSYNDNYLDVYESIDRNVTIGISANFEFTVKICDDNFATLFKLTWM